MFASQKRKQQISLKGALRRMRGIWLKCKVSRFDSRLAKILDCNLERAAEVRETWENLGFLCYDRRGLLTWRLGGF